MAKCVYHDTYWNHNGNHESLLTAVQAMIPDIGEIPEADNKPQLERFRQAANCYYDLYNNGLCNRESEFLELFGFTPEDELTRRDVVRTEKAINRLLIAAAKESRLG